MNAINELPSTFKIGIPELDKDYHFVRTPARYEPETSNNIIGATVFIEPKVRDKLSSYTVFRPSRFTTIDGRRLFKQFSAHASSYFKIRFTLYGKVLRGEIDAYIAFNKMFQVEKQIEYLIKQKKVV